MKRIICMLLSVCMLLCLAACGGNGTPAAGTTAPAAPTESTEPTKEQIPETTEAAQASDTAPTTEPPMPTEDWEDPSLVIFRQAMVETPQLFAAAFFGYVPENADPFAIMREAAPQLCEDLPFLLTIREEHIMGTFGYLFCIVPADESTSVAVNRRPWNAETESYEEPEVLYRSESGSPILVMCPNEDWIPDTEVVITDSNGTVTVWSPYLDPSYRISALRNENGEDLIFDFTSYDELPNPGWNQGIDSSELVGTWPGRKWRVIGMRQRPVSAPSRSHRRKRAFSGSPLQTRSFPRRTSGTGSCLWAPVNCTPAAATTSGSVK